jgi:hypothetical protein
MNRLADACAPWRKSAAPSIIAQSLSIRRSMRLRRRCHSVKRRDADILSFYWFERCAVYAFLREGGCQCCDAIESDLT